MSMFGPKPGSWSLSSFKDPRWNASGRDDILVSAGICPAARQKIDELKTKFGPPPNDLEYSCMKD